jgi:hypothetical protein
VKCPLGFDELTEDKADPLWHRLLGLLGRPASESGRLCHGAGSHEGVPAPERVHVAFYEAAARVNPVLRMNPIQLSRGFVILLFALVSGEAELAGA